jgi:hypothetical protein
MERPIYSSQLEAFPPPRVAEGGGVKKQSNCSQSTG